jgi:copper homeostasis protein
MEVTFHRAFDVTPSLREALEDVITTGAHRILTSGGHTDLVDAATSLRALVTQAEDRITIAVGGGLRVENSASLARLTGAHQFHGSLRRWSDTGFNAGPINEGKYSDGLPYVVEAATIRTVVDNLRQAHDALHGYQHDAR